MSIPPPPPSQKDKLKVLYHKGFFKRKAVIPKNYSVAYSSRGSKSSWWLTWNIKGPTGKVFAIVKHSHYGDQPQDVCPRATAYWHFL